MRNSFAFWGQRMGFFGSRFLHRHLAAWLVPSVALLGRWGAPLAGPGQADGPAKPWGDGALGGQGSSAAGLGSCQAQGGDISGGFEKLESWAKVCLIHELQIVLKWKLMKECYITCIIMYLHVACPDFFQPVSRKFPVTNQEIAPAER